MTIMFPNPNLEGLGGLKYKEIQRQIQEFIITVGPSTVSSVNPVTLNIIQEGP